MLYLSGQFFGLERFRVDMGRAACLVARDERAEPSTSQDFLPIWGRSLAGVQTASHLPLFFSRRAARIPSGWETYCRTPRTSTAKTDDSREGKRSGRSLIVQRPLNQSLSETVGQALIRSQELRGNYGDRAPLMDQGQAKACRVNRRWLHTWEVFEGMVDSLTGQSCFLGFTSAGNTTSNQPRT